MTEIRGIKTGFDVYDNELGGFHKGQLILVEGKPCVGKAAFALSLIDNLCNQNEGTCLYFSVESNPKRLYRKLLEMHCSLESLDNISSDKWNEVAEEGRKLLGVNLIVEGFEVTIEKILSKSIEVASKGLISAIVVDGVSYVADSTGRRVTSVYPALKKLKELAIALNCPIVAYTTLSRFVEKDNEDLCEQMDLYNPINFKDSVDEVIFLFNEKCYDDDGKKRGKIQIGTADYMTGISCTFEMEFTHKYRGKYAV